MTTITSNELKQRLDAGDEVVLLDVRSPAEYESRHIPGARNIPLHTLSVERLSNDGLRDKSLVVLCQGGGRSTQACEILAKAGFTKVFNLSGGTKAWTDAGLPTSGDAGGSMSIERQVRIVAGALVVIGGLGSVLLNPALIWLSIFVGGGLVFAGVTDTCGMAFVLARAPWNNRVNKSRSCPENVCTIKR